MSKPKIYATGNENLSGDFNISHYILEKDENFLEWLGDLLAEVLMINDGKERAKFVVKETYDEGENPKGQEIYIKNIKKMIDLHEHYGAKGDRVDCFYGKDRVYVTFRKSKETRKKFVEFIRKTKDWIEIKEIPKLPIYATKKISRDE